MGYWLAGGLTRALAPEIIELAETNMAGYSVGLAPGVDSFTGILVLTGLIDSGLVAFSLDYFYRKSFYVDPIFYYEISSFPPFKQTFIRI